MPAFFTNIALGLLAMQVMAGPLADANAHKAQHRRHHARHARRACKARPAASASASLIGSGSGTSNGNGTETVPVYVSESGVSLVESSASKIGNEYAATGESCRMRLRTDVY